jgi:hypothetical protein
MYEGRLKIHRAIPGAPDLVREFQDFRVQYSDVGNITFNARSGAHDDLVLALAIGVWVLAGGGMSNFGLFDLYRHRAGGVLPDREVVGVDLGQAADPTAICVVRRTELQPGMAIPQVGPLPVDAGPPAPVYAKGSLEYARAELEKKRQAEAEAKAAAENDDADDLPPAA